MRAAVDAPTLPEGFVRLDASMPSTADPDRVAGILASDDLRWLGEPVSAGGPAESMRRVAADLRLRVGGGSSGLTTFRKAAYVDVGIPRRSGDEWVTEIGWQASTAAPLFPVFSGVITNRPGELRIRGVYAPPGGIVGRLADTLLLHIAANGTARWLLAELDRAAQGTG